MTTVCNKMMIRTVATQTRTTMILTSSRSSTTKSRAAAAAVLQRNPLFVIVLVMITTTNFHVNGFMVPSTKPLFSLLSTRKSIQPQPLRLSQIKNSSETTRTRTTTSKSKPRTGLGQSMLDVALQSPLWEHVLVPQARQTMVKTALSNGIDWKAHVDWLESQNGPWRTTTNESSRTDNGQNQENSNSNVNNNPKVPNYYKQPFHAYYPNGNLSWKAALEVEVASRAVGARNFPSEGKNGEDAFRTSFEIAIQQLCADDDDDDDENDNSGGVPKDAIMVDMGAGTGMSTRRLATNFPQASIIYGYDLSPYYIAVGKELMRLAPQSVDQGGPWVTTIQPDSRIQYDVVDAAHTPLPDNSVDVVNLMFVLHEVPYKAAMEIIDEAHRILKPNTGQLWICEMDFESPAYAAQRANPLLFSLIRATEPYLDEYADTFPQLLNQHIASKFTNGVKITAATGRHYSLVARKGGQGTTTTTTAAATKDSDQERRSGGRLEDTRFNDDGTYRIEDTHLLLWESKKKD